MGLDTRWLGGDCGGPGDEGSLRKCSSGVSVIRFVKRFW